MYRKKQDVVHTSVKENVLNRIEDCTEDGVTPFAIILDEAKDLCGKKAGVLCVYAKM